MLQYVLAGLALGSIYAIASASLVVTFVSAGVLNFAFGSMAYTVARFYYYLNSQHGWGTDTAGALSLLVFAPLLGVVLYLLLFQFLRGKSSLTKIAATIGLSVALPLVANVVMGRDAITTAPGLAALTDQPHKVFGTPVTTDQIITYAFLVFVVIAGTLVLRATDVGLKVRALVDSEAMASLSGTNPNRVALGVWAASTTLAGLAGVLAAPSFNLTAYDMTRLMGIAFAPVVAARLRSLPGVVAIALTMGLVTEVIQKWIPADSSFTAALIPSIPFGFMLIALLVYTARSGGLREDAGAAGPLDAAIKPATEDADVAAAEAASLRGWGALLAGTPLVAVALLPLFFHGNAYWLGLVAFGMCYAITFLNFTLVTGEGGMIWLAQITFAGVGALLTGQFAVHAHLPVLLAVLCAAGVAAVAGAIIGLLTIKLGDLYVALATLTFGGLVEGLIFTRERFQQGGIGVTVARPSWASSDTRFFYLALGVFLVFALLIVNMRRSTSGLALRAVRDSATAARTLGLSVLQMKVIVGSLGAFVAAVGGGFLAMYENVAQPQEYPTQLGLVWLAVVVTLGVRSITAAALAGMSFTLMPGVFATYVPTRWADVPTILFGLGAISVARNPEGAVAQQGHALRKLASRLTTSRPLRATVAAPSDSPPVAVPTPAAAAAPRTVDVAESTPAISAAPTPDARSGRHRRKVTS